MNSANKTNTVLLDALGVDWQEKGRGVVGCTLRLRAGKFPTLTVHRHLTDAVDVAKVFERFEVRPIGEGATS